MRSKFWHYICMNYREQKKKWEERRKRIYEYWKMNDEDTRKTAAAFGISTQRVWQLVKDIEKKLQTA